MDATRLRAFAVPLISHREVANARRFAKPAVALPIKSPNFGNQVRSARLTLVCLSLLLCFCPRPEVWARGPDLILKNGRIWTGSERHAWAEALAIAGGKIVRVGRTSEVVALAGRNSRVINLRGRLAIPGINDAHIHFLSGSLGLSEVDLVGARSLEEIQHRVSEFARSHPEVSWIIGAGWEYSCLSGTESSARASLDAAVADRPVYLRAYDGHTGWANSKALELAGITRNQKFEGFGRIVLDARNGEPTGILTEAAMNLVSRRIPTPSRKSKLAALRKGLQLAASLGITSFQNAGGSGEELSLYQDLLDRHELSARVSFAMSVRPETTQADIEKVVELKKKYSDGLLRVGGIKIFLDGVIESHTAAMLDHYTDMPDSSGVPSYSQGALNRLVQMADKAGLQISIHAIGDRAVQMALDAYERALLLDGPRDARFRIEHIETVAESDIARFAKLGVLASMEPIHADPGTNAVWVPAVGEERCRRAFAWRSLEKAGARLVFSSDWPAAISVDPIRGIHCAVNRRTIDGDPPGGWIPEQRVSVESALRAYTQGGAYASFQERIEGTLEKGKVADIVVLSQNLFKIDPMEIYKTRVLLTVFDGRVVYGSDPAPE
jgi:predicted amidohydrolase YtcJ